MVASLCVFAICFPLFLYAETLATRPILPLRIVRHSPRANLIFSNFFAALLTNAILFNMPLFFQAVLLTSATESGLMLIIPSLIASATGASTGFLITWTCKLKWPVMTGTLFFLIGGVLLASPLLKTGLPAVVYLLFLIPSSMGQGFQFPGTFMAVLAASKQEEQAVVTSTLILWRNLGMVLGVSGSSLVVQNALFGYLKQYITSENQCEVIDMVRKSVEAVAKLDDSSKAEATRAYKDALSLAFSVCAVISAISVCLILPIKLPKLASRK